MIDNIFFWLQECIKRWIKPATLLIIKFRRSGCEIELYLAGYEWCIFQKRIFQRHPYGRDKSIFTI
jgi:hypothetical protein